MYTSKHIANALAAAEIPLDQRAKVREALRETDKNRIAHTSQKLRDLDWKGVIDPLSHAIRNARVRENTSRGHAANAVWLRYVDLLTRTRAQLELFQRQGMRRSDAIAHQMQHKGLQVPNNGSAWQDWVSETQKQHARAAFAALPRTKGKRFFTPFEVNKTQARLITRKEEITRRALQTLLDEARGLARHAQTLRRLPAQRNWEQIADIWETALETFNNERAKTPYAKVSVNPHTYVPPHLRHTLSLLKGQVRNQGE